MSIIEVRGLSKSFEDRWVLSNVNFQVEEGDIFGYLGPNGAGKTTTMRIMLGLLKPTHGEALINGKDMANDGEMRKRVGVLLEKNGIYDRLSAHDNLQYFARLYGVDDVERKITEQLELVGLTDRKDQKAGKFSKGMKQRLGLARAMIHDPEIMFLDEPSSGLDPEAQKLMRDIIVEMSKKKKITVFLNSHNLDEVQRVCNRIAILQHGTIRAYDTVENMRSTYSRPMMEFTFMDEATADRAHLVLAALVGEGGIFRKGPSIEVATDSVPPEELIERLVQNGVRVTEAKRLKKSLEEVYIDIIKQAGVETMNWNQVKIVAVKEMREIISSKGTIISTIFFALWFGLLNGQVADGVTSDSLSKQLFFMAPMLGALMGYLLTGTVFSNEKKDGVIETLLCTPLDLRTIWLGKLIGVSIVAYLASLISISFVILLASMTANALLVPSVVILVHIVLTVPLFTAAVVGLIGYSQLLLGMKENTVIGIFTFLGLFIGLSVAGGLVAGTGSITPSMLFVMFLVAAALLAFTFYLARFLSKEKVIITIP